MDEVELLDVALELPSLVLRDDNEFLSDTKDHICVIEERDLMSLNREFDYSDRFCPNFDGVDLSDILDVNGTVDISDVKLDDVLFEDFSNEVNEILVSIPAPDILDKQKTIISHEYYTRSLEYLVHNAWDCVWMKHGQLKADELLLVAKYIEENKNIFSKCASRLKTRVKGIFEANEGCI